MKCRSLVASILAFYFIVSVIRQAEAQSVTRLTSNTAEDTYPAWDPASETIAYLRSKSTSGQPRDLYKVQADGTGEGPMATGLNSGLGLAASPSWYGTSGSIGIYEQVNFHEYLLFNSALAPFSRTATDGADSAFSVLASIPGGTAGGVIRFSRDGSTVLVRHSTVSNAGVISLLVGAASGLAGQSVDTFGTAILSVNAGSDARFLGGMALTPDGSEAVIPVPFTTSATSHDLFLYSTTNAHAPVQLTFGAANGVTSVVPDVSPDGTKILFTRANVTGGLLGDLFIMNLDGTGVTQVTDTPNFAESFPSWAPDGKRAAFLGQHFVGKETFFPALPAGETANGNIYTMNVTQNANANGVVTPKTVLDSPPDVMVVDNDVTLILKKFRSAKLTSKALRRQFSTGGLLWMPLAAKQPGVSFQFDARVSRSDTGKQIAKKTSKRNQVAFKNVPAGTYSAKYRVQILKKVGSVAKVQKSTKFSPSATFTIN